MAVKAKSKAIGKARSLENLKNIKKGQVLNPKGRPAGIPNKSTIERGVISTLLTYVKEQLDGPEARKYTQSFFKTAWGKPDSWQSVLYAKLMLQPDVFSRIDEIVNREVREDRDFLGYRIYKSAFDVQQRILLSQAKAIILMAGRRAGKTEAFARWFAEPMVTIDNARCLYVGKTMFTAVEQIYSTLCGILKELGARVVEQRRNEGYIKLDNRSEFYIRGNNSVEEREKLRGFKWHRAGIDECQSQTALPYLIHDILEPELVDYNGQLALAGTGPRVRGMYWEMLWTGKKTEGQAEIDVFPNAFRANWNLTQNPFIPDHEAALATIRREKNLTESSSLYIREYLGRIAYDDDALVIRLQPGNLFTDDDLVQWLSKQPRPDIRFTAGLDFGFVDSDAFGIVCYSTSFPEKWLVYEYKGNRTGVAALADKIREGIQYVATSPLFKEVGNKKFFIHADTGGAGKKIGFDLATQYSLPVQDAYKANKDLAVELLQEEVRRGELRIRQGGPFQEEAMRTVFARNDRDELTREIDDETYHPDMMDAVCYGMRTIWWFQKRIKGE